jgi:hypothetical protein
MESLSISALENKKVNFTVNSKDVPTNFPIRLTTSGLDFLFPGLEEQFGVDIPVNVDFELRRIH